MLTSLNDGITKAMIRVTSSDVVVSPGAVSRLRAEFAETGCAMVPGFLTPPVLMLLLKHLQMAPFEVADEKRPQGEVFGTTFRMPRTESAAVIFDFVLNRPALFGLAAEIACSAPLDSFVGRLHRTIGGTSQHIDWHDDDADFRTVGLDVNLSAGEYDGGLFQMRGPDRIIRKEISTWTPGDAFFFRIGDGWQHRLTRVESGERTVGVGWFRTQPGLWRQAVSGMRTGVLSEEAK